MFQANPGDTACPGQFYLWGDRYSNGGGYQGACSRGHRGARPGTPKTITMTNAGVPRPRHGTVIPISLREWNAVRGIPNPDVATTTTVEVAPEVDEGSTTTVTATVTAADTFETGGQVRFSAGGWSATAYLEGGRASVELPGDLGVGPQTVTAEFLGHDVLDTSSASGQTVVVPLLAADASVEVRCVGGGNGARAVLEVLVTNPEPGQTVDVTVTSDHGTKTRQNVRPDTTVSFPFTTRLATLPAGSATVTLTAGDGEAEVTSTRTVTWEQEACGRR